MNENEKKLIGLLQQKNPQSASELSEQLNVSNRTVYRWAEKLAEKGLKIITTKGRNVGIFLEDVNIDLSSFEDKPSPKPKAKLNKTSAKVKNMTSNMSTFSDAWLEVSFSEQDKASKLDIKYDICKEAVIQSKVLSFSYNLPEGKTLNCTTEPVRLYLANNEWHILAWIRKVDKYKLFKLSYITDLELHSEKFTRQADFVIQEVLK
jgi:predicted DNA-binding transcriptional regulator YafY